MVCVVQGRRRYAKAQEYKETYCGYRARMGVRMVDAKAAEGNGGGIGGGGAGEERRGLSVVRGGGPW